MISHEEYMEIIEKFKEDNKEEIKLGKVRHIFLDCLPKWDIKKNYGKFNWLESINSDVYFIYEEIEGYIKIISYISGRVSKLIIKYKEKENIIINRDFQKCRLEKILEKRTKDFKIETGQILKDDKRDLIITDRKYKKKTYIKNNGIENNCSKKYYKYTCNKCGWTEGWVEENALMYQKQGCSCCCNKTTVLGINSIWDTNPWMIPYIGEEIAKTHVYNSHKKIFPVCPECLRIKSKNIPIYTIYKEHSIGCSCGDGIKFPNKFAFNFMEQLLGMNNFETEYNPDWIKPKSYDFHFKLNNKEYILEMDGGFHSIDNKMNGQTKEESNAIDNYKDRLANEHGIEVIRIDCFYENKNRFEYVKNNILNNKKLNILFDLTKIDWIKCGEYTCSNLVKIACEYKKNNTELTTKDIAKLMGYSRGAILKWLKQGSELNLCKYNAKEESKRTCSKNGKSLGKPLIIFKKDIMMGISLSIAELERESTTMFSIRLDHSIISAICLGKKIQYKGYTFKFISDLTPEEMIKYDIANKLKEIKEAI